MDPGCIWVDLGWIWNGSGVDLGGSGVDLGSHTGGVEVSCGRCGSLMREVWRSRKGGVDLGWILGVSGWIWGGSGVDLGGSGVDLGGFGWIPSPDQTLCGYLKAAGGIC